MTLRTAVRSLRRSPGYTAVALLFLALGIGANAALFSLLNALSIRLLPFGEPVVVSGARVVAATVIGVSAAVGLPRLFPAG